jgi:predicted NBD/HSP70 family sugar kinase
MVGDAINVFADNNAVIKYLYYNKAASNTDISFSIRKSIPNTLKVLNELIAQGYVKENGLGISSGGRKPLTYSLIADNFYILSVAMDQFITRMVIVDAASSFVTPVSTYSFNIYEHKEDVGALAEYIGSFIELSGISKGKMLGIGISMPGFVDVEQGINFSYLRNSDNTLVGHLEKCLSLPVFIDNDSTSIALAEQKFGVAGDKKNVMVINLGWGIGLGMILNGEIFRGNNGLAGEFSHIPLFKNGKLCTCGKHGCLETEASLIAVIDKATEGVKNEQVSSLASYDIIDADAIIAEAIKGDVFSVKLLSEAAYLVGQGLAILIHLMNPAAIILSGKGSIVGKLWMAPIQHAINEHCIPKLTNYTEFLISDLNSKAQLIGSAALVIESLGGLFRNKYQAVNNSQLDDNLIFQ